MASEVNPEKLKKKRHPLRWIVLIFLVLVLVLPVGLVFIFFYDTSSSSFERDPNFSKEKALLQVSVDSLDNTKETGMINYAIPENMFNNLMALGFDQAGEKVTNIVRKTAIEFHGNQYILSAEFNLYDVFKTRLYVYTTVTKVTDGEETEYIFKIDNVVIGRASRLFGIAQSYFQQYIDDSIIKEVFNSFGYSVIPDLQNQRVIYKEKDLLNDMNNLLGQQNQENNRDKLFFSILNEFLDRNAFTFDFETEGQIGGKVDIRNSRNNENFCSPEKLVDRNFDPYKEKCLEIMNKGLMTDLSNTDTLLSFLINGFDRSSDATKEFALSLDLSSVGIPDVTTYEGYNLGEKEDILSSVHEDAQNRVTLGTVWSDNILSRLEESNLDNSIKNQSLVGHTFSLAREVNPGEYKMNYIYVDNFYTNIVDDHIYFIVNFNINGYPNCVILDAAATGEDVGEYKIQFTMEDIYYGDRLANTVLKDVLYDLVTQSVQGEDWIWVKFTEDKKEMVIDLSDGIPSDIKTTIEGMGKHGHCRVKGNGVNDNGYLETYLTD